MNKLINLKITNNKLNLEFEDGGYIRVSNLHLFDLSIAECSEELNCINLFKTEFDHIEIYNNIIESITDELKINKTDLSKHKILKIMERFMSSKDKFNAGLFLTKYDEYDNSYNYKHKCLICSNEKAILLKFSDIKPFEERTPFEILQNEVKILKENFEVFDVENYYNDIEFALRDVFIDYRDIYKEHIKDKDQEQKLESEENQKFTYVAANKELLYDNLQKQVSEHDFDLILAYSTYNFNYLINNILKKPSKRLRDSIYNFLDNYITDLLKSKNFDLQLYKILFKNFQIQCKKILLKFDAEQIGPDHEKRWQISNFSFNN